jgi:hypothetical protein
MKIVLIGESVAEGWAQTFKRGFESLGHIAVIVDDREIYRSSSPLARNRYAHRLLWRLLAGLAQSKMLSAVEKENPDMIFMLKGWLWQPRTFRALKLALPKALLINYNPDSPFNTEAHGNANNWIRESIPLFDTYLIWSKELTERIKAAGAKHSYYLPCGYDPELHSPVKVSAEDSRVFGSDIAFVGSWDKEREEWMRGLLGYDLKIWGNSWEKAADDVRAKWQGRAAVIKDFSKVCDSTKIMLNFLRPQNKSSHNMKTFEIPACKGFMLAERSPEELGFFEEGKEAEYFATLSELKQKIDKYLQLPEERRRIAEAAYARLIRENNSYKDRAAQVIRWCEELI